MKVKIEDRVKEVIPENGKFSAVDIAEKLCDIDIRTIGTIGWRQSSCPKITKVLTKLCKDGLLYQWVCSSGEIAMINDCASKWELYYLRRDSSLAKTLIERRAKYLNGYRFR